MLDTLNVIAATAGSASYPLTIPVFQAMNVIATVAPAQTTLEERPMTPPVPPNAPMSGAEARSAKASAPLAG